MCPAGMKCCTCVLSLVLTTNLWVLLSLLSNSGNWGIGRKGNLPRVAAASGRVWVRPELSGSRAHGFLGSHSFSILLTSNFLEGIALQIWKGKVVPRASRSDISDKTQWIDCLLYSLRFWKDLVSMPLGQCIIGIWEHPGWLALTAIC